MTASKGIRRSFSFRNGNVVPAELKESKIGSLDDGALALSMIIKRYTRKQQVTVLCDRGGDVYATRYRGKTVESVVMAYPDVVVGTYTATADAADIAADIETFRREIAA